MFSSNIKSISSRNRVISSIYFFYHLDNGNCPPRYLDIMSKCLWLLCDYQYPTGAEYVCSRKFGTLASFDETSFARIAEYLNHIRVRNIGISQVSYMSGIFPSLPARPLQFTRKLNARKLNGGESSNSKF